MLPLLKPREEVRCGPVGAVAGRQSNAERGGPDRRGARGAALGGRSHRRRRRLERPDGRARPRARRRRHRGAGQEHRRAAQCRDRAGAERMGAGARRGRARDRRAARGARARARGAGPPGLPRALRELLPGTRAQTRPLGPRLACPLVPPGPPLLRGSRPRAPRGGAGCGRAARPDPARAIPGSHPPPREDDRVCSLGRPGAARPRPPRDRVGPARPPGLAVRARLHPVRQLAGRTLRTGDVAAHGLRRLPQVRLSLGARANGVRAAPAMRLPILMYHKVDRLPPSPGARYVRNYVLPEQFDAPLAALPPPRVLAELRDSRTALAQLLGAPVRVLCYPFGKQNAAVRALAREAGYEAAVIARRRLNSSTSDPLRLTRLRIDTNTRLPALRWTLFQLHWLWWT